MAPPLTGSRLIPRLPTACSQHEHQGVNLPRGVGSSTMPVDKSQSTDQGASPSAAVSPADRSKLRVGDTDKAKTDVPSAPSAPTSHKRMGGRRLLLGVAAALLLAVILVFG